MRKDRPTQITDFRLLMYVHPWFEETKEFNLVVLEPLVLICLYRNKPCFYSKNNDYMKPKDLHTKRCQEICT